MDDSEMVKLLPSRKAQGYRVTTEKAEEDSHSPVIHAMEQNKENHANQYENCRNSGVCYMQGLHVKPLCPL